MADHDSDRHQIREILRHLVLAILADITEADWGEEVDLAIETAEAEFAERDRERGRHERLAGARLVLYARVKSL